MSHPIKQIMWSTPITMFIILTIAFVAAAFQAEKPPSHNKKEKKHALRNRKLILFYQWFSGLFITMSGIHLALYHLIGPIHKENSSISQDPFRRDLGLASLAAAIAMIVIQSIWSPKHASKQSYKPYIAMGFTSGFLFLLSGAHRTITLGNGHEKVTPSVVMLVVLMWLIGLALLIPGVIVVRRGRQN